MSQKVTKDEVKKMAELANIHIDDSELEKYGKWISDILEYVQMLNEIEVDDVEFKSQVDLVNVLDEDVAEPSLTAEQVISNRKDESVGSAFTISSVLESE